MSYLRPVKLEELKTWLRQELPSSADITEVDVEVLAEALMDRFEIITKSSTL